VGFEDVSSRTIEGRRCPLARRGDSQDGKPGTLQIIHGMLFDLDITADIVGFTRKTGEMAAEAATDGVAFGRFLFLLLGHAS
jgi:hypothetical protein